jgi:hypothetical protein
MKPTLPCSCGNGEGPRLTTHQCRRHALVVNGQIVWTGKSRMLVPGGCWRSRISAALTITLKLERVCPLLRSSACQSIAFYRDVLGFEIVATSQPGP